jgi:hypothetical protein
MVDQEVCVFSLDRRNCRVMLSGGLEGLNRPSIHFGGLSNMFGWLLLCAGNVAHRAAFAFLIWMASLVIHRRAADCSLLGDPALPDWG